MTTYLAPEVHTHRATGWRIRQAARISARWINRLILAVAAAQFYTAGLAIFGASSFEFHQVGGWLTQLLSLLAVVACLAARLPLAVSGLAFLLLAQVILQPVLAFAVRASFPALSAAHPVNGLAIVLVSIVLERRLRGTT